MTTISFDDVGAGPPIVLVHGFASNRTVNWKNTGWYKYLTSMGRRVIALDLRGHGASHKYHGIESYHPDRMTGDIIGLMDSLDIDRADVMGYSMGAWLSAHLLANWPDRFRSGILGGIGDNLLRWQNRDERMANALSVKLPSAISDVYLRALMACTRGVYATGAPGLERITRPVLIVGGDLDTVVGAPHEFAKKIPGAVVDIIPGRDHMSLVLARAFKRSVGEFLAK
ncbi:MAG: alpha/beta fold hydrolase [Deltaproteobacteria bacterium]|nr:alpha/beta fold hydrolase [Deltaproteobacteria bacterium]